MRKELTSYKRPAHWQRNRAPAVVTYNAKRQRGSAPRDHHVCEWPNSPQYSLSQGLYLIEKGIAQGIGVGHGDESLKQGFHLRQPAREPLRLLQEPAPDVCAPCCVWHRSGRPAEPCLVFPAWLTLKDGFCTDLDTWKTRARWVTRACRPRKLRA